MDLYQAIILALIQGMSEFLPISSSAHLILPSQVLGWNDQGLAFDVAVHVGSLAAVVVFYFRHELREITSAFVGQWFTGPKNEASPIHAQSQAQTQANVKLGWLIIVGTMPVLVVAALYKNEIELHLRSSLVIATTTIAFGLLLGLAEWQSHRQKRVVELGFGIALLIGLAQAMALVPGTSRSGVTITAAVLLGLSRTEAARFSFLLSVPVILLAGLFLAFELVQADVAVEWGFLALATLVSGLSAWSCITLFLKLIERIGLMPFVLYRLVLGGVLIAIA